MSGHKSDSTSLTSTLSRTMNREDRDTIDSPQWNQCDSSDQYDNVSFRVPELREKKKIVPLSEIMLDGTDSVWNLKGKLKKNNARTNFPDFISRLEFRTKCANQKKNGM